MIKLQINYIKKNYDKIKKPFQIFINDNKHQYKNSECGMYSIYYITQFLEGKTFDQVSNTIMSDDNVYKYRYKFYRPNSLEKKNKSFLPIINKDDDRKHILITDPIIIDKKYNIRSKKGKEILSNINYFVNN